MSFEPFCILHLSSFISHPSSLIFPPSSLRNAQRLRVFLPLLHIGAVVATSCEQSLCGGCSVSIDRPLISCGCCASRMGQWRKGDIVTLRIPSLSRLALRKRVRASDSPPHAFPTAIIADSKRLSTSAKKSCRSLPQVLVPQRFAHCAPCMANWLRRRRGALSLARSACRQRSSGVPADGALRGRNSARREKFFRFYDRIYG